MLENRVNRILDILNHTNSVLFEDLTDVEISAIADSPLVSLGRWKKGEVLFSQGDTPQALFVLGKGTVTVEKIDVNGKRTIVNVFSSSGTIFGEVYLYLENHPYDYSCVAQSQVEVLAISKSFFTSLYSNTSSQSRKILHNMLRILSEKAFFLNQKLLILSSRSLRQKIAYYLLLQKEEGDAVQLGLNRESLADYLGTTRPSLSREMMRMEEEGYIQVEKDVITLLNPLGLEEML